MPPKPKVAPPTLPEEKIEAAAEVEEPPIRFPDWHDVPELKAVRFEYDKSNLLAEARDILKENAEYIKTNTDLNILVEGHCDERGTIEYNLGLGQRRASAVRDYYGKLGVALKRVGTISYGEEKPLDTAHTEEAWAKNRRAETKARSIKPEVEDTEDREGTEGTETE